jgi:hypothetical protein
MWLAVSLPGVCVPRAFKQDQMVKGADPQEPQREPGDEEEDGRNVEAVPVPADKEIACLHCWCPPGREKPGGK